MPDHIGILVKGRNIACVSFAALPHDGRCYTLVGGCPVSDVLIHAVSFRGAAIAASPESSKLRQ